MIGEVQALSVQPVGPPRRAVSGIDSARAAMIAAPASAMRCSSA